MAYVDGFLAPVFPGRREEYRVMCIAAAEIFMDHGALQVVECFGDDVPTGKLTDMHKAVAAEADEGLVFSWTVWPSKDARAKGWEAAMADERMKPSPDMPFDGKRIIFGGFDVLFDTAGASSIAAEG